MEFEYGSLPLKWRLTDNLYFLLSTKLATCSTPGIFLQAGYAKVNQRGIPFPVEALKVCDGYHDMLIQRFLNLLPPDISSCPVILDVGSCTGEQSCEFATQFPRAQIFAFEARPQSAETIRENVARYSNIEVIESAVHEFDGETTFHVVNERNPGASSLFVGSGVQTIHPIQQTPINVSAIRLDTWAKKAEIKRFDIVWMDLQGAELLALRGMGAMLRTVRAIQLEITYRELYSGQVMWPEVRVFLESNGLRLVDEWPDTCGYFGDAVYLRDAPAIF